MAVAKYDKRKTNPKVRELVKSYREAMRLYNGAREAYENCYKNGLAHRHFELQCDKDRAARHYFDLVKHMEMLEELGMVARNERGHFISV